MLPRGGAERLEEKRVYAIPVDNTVYDQIDAEIDQRGAVAGELSSSADWWDDRSFLHFLYTAVNPARFAYFDAFLKEHAPPTANRPDHTVTILDVGCGGGFLAEEFSRRGYSVIGIDPSGPSVACARAHAQRYSLEGLTYVQGIGESLPFPSGSFDVVSCCDVLEHVESRDAVLAEIARVLRPRGGIFLYDTINRTWLSRLLFIHIAQRWRWTRFAPTDLHDAAFFVAPADLHAEMRRHGIVSHDITGLRPAHIFRRALPLLLSLHQVRRGRMTPGEFGRRFAFAAHKDTRASYMGCGHMETGSKARNITRS